MYKNPKVIIHYNAYNNTKFFKKKYHFIIGKCTSNLKLNLKLRKMYFNTEDLKQFGEEVYLMKCLTNRITDHKILIHYSSEIAD